MSEFLPGDEVRVTEHTLWRDYRGRVGHVYPAVSQVHGFAPGYLMVIFTPNHAERAEQLMHMSPATYIEMHPSAYRRGEQANIESSCLELVRHAGPHKRRGKRHKMRTHLRGVYGETLQQPQHQS